LMQKEGCDPLLLHFEAPKMLTRIIPFLV